MYNSNALAGDDLSSVMEMNEYRRETMLRAARQHKLLGQHDHVEACIHEAIGCHRDIMRARHAG